MINSLFTGLSLVFDRQLLVPVASAFDWSIARPLGIGAVVVHKIVLPDVVELFDLVVVQILIGSTVPPVPLPGAALSDVATSDLAGVHAESLKENQHEGE